MNSRDLWQIMSIDAQKFAKTDFRSPGFTAGERPRPGAHVLLWNEDPFEGEMRPRADIVTLLADDRFPWQRDRVRIVPAPTCGCCGIGGFSRADLHLVDMWEEAEDRIWRCEKHVGRLPCMIEGCGRTFALKPGDDYRNSVICGQHYRLAPKRDRDLRSKVRRKAKRHGWSASLIALDQKLWNRCLETILEGQKLDEAEINRMFGWDE